MPSTPAGTPTEDQEQRQLATWLDYIGVLWCHVPNGGMRAKQFAAKMKAHGLKAGVPDVMIFTPPPAMPDKRGVAIELKRVKGGQLSDQQKYWLQKLQAIGWEVSSQKGAQASIDWLISLGYGPMH